MRPEDWIGRSRSVTDPMDPWAARAFIATLELDRPQPMAGDPLPPFWHWMHFLEAAPRSALGRDGHPATGGFMPAVAQPRRMWAGGRLEFPGEIALGHPATRTETIEAVVPKSGRSGSLTFVTVAHEIRSGTGPVAVREWQDIVYREDPDPAAPAPTPPRAPEGETHRADWSCDATVLFRYSALTFNGHRIHYDPDYARSVEGYPGLVVHGPLLATLLLELARTAGGGRRIATFAFRATAPVFAGEPFSTCARPGEGGELSLWVRAGDGRQAMTATATLR